MTSRLLITLSKAMKGKILDRLAGLRTRLITLNHLKSVYGSRGDSVKNLMMAGGWWLVAGGWWRNDSQDVILY
jgi:hypothetical protein